MSGYLGIDPSLQPPPAVPPGYGENAKMVVFLLGSAQKKARDGHISRGGPCPPHEL